MQTLLQAGVQFLEALATLLASRNGSPPVAPPDVLKRGTEALEKIARGLKEKKDG